MVEKRHLETSVGQKKGLVLGMDIHKSGRQGCEELDLDRRIVYE